MTRYNFVVDPKLVHHRHVSLYDDPVKRKEKKRTKIIIPAFMLFFFRMWPKSHQHHTKFRQIFRARHKKNTKRWTFWLVPIKILHLLCIHVLPCPLYYIRACMHAYRHTQRHKSICKLMCIFFTCPVYALVCLLACTQKYMYPR